ncbi:MAG: class I SAM-dependent methyltransferase [Lachnospiraceae bacterium]|nr:class I SAM-dependent methyltransferase [Lachnospiraceae bacterium]
MMVTLSRRLQAVAALAEPGKIAADIGCDHGYVSIWLIQQKIFSKVIAMDVRPGPLETARKNVALYRMEDAIELRLSDGLRMLGIGEADCMICAGMGGALICHILEDAPEKAKTMKQIILQPQSELFLVRRFLRQHGYAITKEDMVKEDGKYYPMLRAVWQEEQVKLAEECQDIYDAYGRLLLEGHHPVLYEWLLHEQTVTRDILSGLQKAIGAERDTAASRRQRQRLSELQEKQRRIEAALSYYA